MAREDNNILYLDNNEYYLIWSGRNFKDFGVDFKNIYSFKRAIEKVENSELEMMGFKNTDYNSLQNIFIPKVLSPKDEFETEAEYQNRKRRFELAEKERRKLFELKKKEAQEKFEKMRKEKLSQISQKIKKMKGDILNSYLGEQKIEMKYNPELKEFNVSTSSRFFSFFFKIKIPRDIAREFKEKVKNFDFLCKYKDGYENVKYDVKVGTKRVKSGEKRVKVGIRKKKIGIEIKNYFWFFNIEKILFEEEPIYNNEPIYKEEPIYEKQIRREKRTELRIVKARKKFKNRLFEAKLDFDILMEEFKREIKKEYEHEFV